MWRRRRQRRIPRRRTVWVKPWLLRRPLFGQYKQLLQELHREDERGYRNFLRVPPRLFMELVERVGPHIKRKDTAFRKCIDPGLRIAITLRYLATGDSYKSLQYGFRVAYNTISKIIPDTIPAILNEYMEESMPCPKTPDQWREVAESFGKRWNFHNCIGAIDGKHIAIKCPSNCGTYYFNYKGFHSIVLLALVDANYKFLYIDVGANGLCSDGGVFKDSNLYKALEDGTAGLPPRYPLPNDDQALPHFICGDDAFGLRTWLLKPYPHRGMTRQERVFNYRLSRARRVSENAFGILVHR